MSGFFTTPNTTPRPVLREEQARLMLAGVGLHLGAAAKEIATEAPHLTQERLEELVLNLKLQTTFLLRAGNELRAAAREAAVLAKEMQRREGWR